MTAPAIHLHTRRGGPVESLPLAAPADLRAAEEWLRDHDVPVVRAHPSLMAAHALRFWPRPGQSLTAILGQRLVYDTGLDLFSVLTETDFLAATDSTEGESA